MNKVLVLSLVFLLLPLASAFNILTPTNIRDITGAVVVESTSLSIAEKISNPKELDSVVLDISEKGNLTAPSESAFSVKLKLLSYPKEDKGTIISNLKTNPQATLKREGSTLFYEFKWNSISKTEHYSLSYTVTSKRWVPEINNKIAFPYSKVPIEYKIYIQATDKIDSDNLNIKRKANELAAGETDAYRVVYKIADFVNKEVKYNINYLGKLKKASWVLKNKEGVCVEYATLFMALVRSLGIPARYVSGIAYGDVYGAKFAPHAWVEVYFPTIGWIPFDPTFGEFGWVDPTHIKTQLSTDSNISAIEYSWKGGDLQVSAPETSVNLITANEMVRHILTAKLWVEEAEVSSGSYNIVWLEIKNPTPNYIITEAYLTSAPEIIGSNQRHIFLEPYGSDTVSWIIKIPDELEDNYIYTYQIEAKVLLGSVQETKLIIDPQTTNFLSLNDVLTKSGQKNVEPKIAQPDVSVAVNYPKQVFLNEYYNITLRIKNNGTFPVESMDICIKNLKRACLSKYIGINDEEEVIFNLPATVEGVERVFLTYKGTNIEQRSQVIDIVVVRKTFFLVLSEKLGSIIEFLRNIFKS